MSYQASDVALGFAQRRAKRVLYLMESRTAEAKLQGRHSVTRYSLEHSTADLLDFQFYDTVSRQEALPVAVSLQDIERYAERWVHLIPASPHIRAMLVRLLTEKYSLTYPTIPHLRQALGMDSPEVKEQYQALFNSTLERVYHVQAAPTEQARWAWHGMAHRLETLSPFWAVYAIVLTETVGGGILAMPIAMAQLGVLGGVAAVVILGLISLLTMLYVSEALIRSGNVRYQGAYLGRVVADYLGGTASALFTLAVVSVLVAALLAFMIGVGQTLSTASGLSPVLWVTLLFGIILYFLSRGSLDSTIATALIIGAVNLVLIGLLAGLAFTRFNVDYLRYSNIPLVDTSDFDPAVLSLFFGVILLAYWGHTAVGNVAVTTLRKDPSGRSLQRGVMAAHLTAIAIYALWIFAFNSAFAPEVLAAENGTVLIPLRAEVGVITDILGALFCILSLGLVSVYVSLGLFNLVRERLPLHVEREVILRMHQGEIILRPRPHSGNQQVSIGIVYLGLQNKRPRFRFEIQVGDRTIYDEQIVTQTLDLRQQLAQIPDINLRGVELTMQVSVADREKTKFMLFTSMLMSMRFDWDRVGLRAVTILDLPDSMRSVVNWIIRQPAFSPQELGETFNLTDDKVTLLIEDLLAEGYIRPAESAGQYRIRTAAKRGSSLSEDIWVALGRDKDSHPPLRRNTELETHFWRDLWRDIAMHPWGRFLLSSSPVSVIFGLTVLLLITDKADFTAVLGYVGTLAATMVIGVFTGLLILSSRRKGELLPAYSFAWIGRTGVVMSLCGLFIGVIFLYGVVIWDALPARLAAVGVGLLCLWLLWRTWRGTALHGRTVIQVWEEPSAGDLQLMAVQAGKPYQLPVFLSYSLGEKELTGEQLPLCPLEQVRTLTFALPPQSGGQDAKLWVHQIKADGMSEPLPVRVEVQQRGSTRRYDLKLIEGQVIAPLESDVTEWTVVFEDEPEATVMKKP